MNTITFGVKDKINGNHLKLVVCHQTKQYERGKLCVNSSFVDVWVSSQKALNVIQRNLFTNGYTKTDEEFRKETK